MNEKELNQNNHRKDSTRKDIPIQLLEVQQKDRTIEDLLPSPEDHDISSTDYGGSSSCSPIPTSELKMQNPKSTCTGTEVYVVLELNSAVNGGTKTTEEERKKIEEKSAYQLNDNGVTKNKARDQSYKKKLKHVCINPVISGCSSFYEKLFLKPTLFPTKSPRPPVASLLVPCLWSFAAAVTGLAPLCALHWLVLVPYNSTNYSSLSLVAFSFGAASVLLYDACESPMVQPRNAVFGQTVSAFVGVTVRICLGPHPYAAGPLSVALAIVGMRLTHSTHPPGGATAFIAACTESIPNGPMAYVFVALPILIGSLWLTFVAAIFNNINPRRQYPAYWL